MILQGTKPAGRDGGPFNDAWSGLHLSPADVEALARRLWGEPNRRLSTARELRFGRRGSLAVVPARGVFYDHETGIGGGVLAMLVHAGAAATLAEAARLLESEDAIQPRETSQERRQRDRAAEAALASRRAVAASLVASAAPLKGSPAERYLRDVRAIAAPLDGAGLGFLTDALVYPYGANTGERRPAMVAAVVNAGGKLTGAHLTFLRPDGLGKAADLTTDRKMVGTVGGGCVRLAPGTGLVVAEGVESALSAWEALYGPAQGLGCVAALSAGGVAGLAWPRGTTALYIAADRDASGVGERAAAELATRGWAAGLEVFNVPPPPIFNDWNDAAQAGKGRP